MRIKVCCSGRDRSSVSVPDNATVSGLKRVIETQERIPYEEQTLTFNGLLLEDGKLISEYGLFDQCTILLYLRLGFQPAFGLTVILPSKKRVNLNMSGDDTVEDLKKCIEKKIEHSLGDAELIYAHWVLDDDRKLMEYDISRGATILVVNELKSGDSLKLRDSTQGEHLLPIPHSSNLRFNHKTSKYSHGRRNVDVDESESEQNDEELITVIFLAKTGSPISLKVHPSTPIGKVRGKLARILHVPSRTMWFVRDGKSLNPSKTFSHYGISNGESVCLLSQGHVVENPKSWLSSEEETGEPKIRIIAQSNNGHGLACHVRKTTAVRTLKRRLERELGVSRSKISLFYKKTVLADEDKMEDYDLSDGSVIYLRY